MNSKNYSGLFVRIQRIQDMEERRIEKVGESMKMFAEIDRQVLPIVGKCLDGMTKSAESIEPKLVSRIERAYVEHFLSLNPKKR